MSCLILSHWKHQWSKGQNFYVTVYIYFCYSIEYVCCKPFEWVFVGFFLSVSVIIMCMHSILVGGELQATFLLQANTMGLTSGDYVFVPYDTLLYSVPYGNISYFPLHNNSRLREAYDAVLTITMASEPLSFDEALTAAKKNEEVTLAVISEQVGN